MELVSGLGTAGLAAAVRREKNRLPNIIDWFSALNVLYRADNKYESYNQTISTCNNNNIRSDENDSTMSFIFLALRRRKVKLNRDNFQTILIHTK